MGNETADPSAPCDSLQEVRNRLVLGINKAFNAQLLLWLGVLRDDPDDVDMALDNGANPNAPCTSEIQQAVTECGYSF